MGSPKHLWSGDWEDESAAGAARRGTARPAAPANSDPSPDPPETGPPARSVASELRRRTAAFDVRRWGAAVGAVLLLAVVAGAAVAVLDHGSSSSSTTSSALRAPTATVPQLAPGMGQGLPNGGLPYSQSPSQPSGSAWLGVTLGHSSSGGAVVDGIVAGGPADQGGVRPGDVILAIGNQSVGSPTELINLEGRLAAGQTVDIRVRRGSATFTTQVTLGSRAGAYSTP